MSRKSNLQFVKPMLEQLEDRVQPSFLLSGVVQQQLAVPLNNMVADMKTAQGHLQFDFNQVINNANNNNLAGAIKSFGIAVGDYQQMLTDLHSINATSAADMAFIKAAAFAEFQSGDATDLVVLIYGPNFGIDPTKSLTDPVQQANNIIQSQSVQNEISVNILGGATIQNEATLPTF